MRSRLRRPATLLTLAGVLLLTACVNTEPSAVVIDGSRQPISDDDAGATTPTTAPPATGGTTDPPVDLGPAQPGEHATIGSWQPCAGSFECSTLTVPKDWSEPDGATLDLAVTRHRATGDRIGSLLLNPGGPGASGVSFVQSFVRGGLPAGLSERFDVMSWDPRGTGGTNRIDCTSDEDWLEPSSDAFPDDEAELAEFRAEVSADMEGCEADFGDLLGLVGTRATVRDLDALRAQVGDDRLTYVGYSYGTTIGMEYLRMYPDRVRAMVLDGVSVPGVEPVQDTLVQARGFERTLQAYLDGCAERTSCTLGDDPMGTLIGLTETLDGEAIDADYQLQAQGSPPRRGVLGEADLYIAVAASLYDDASWPLLDQGLDEALAEQPTGRTLLAIRDSYLGRQSDGTWVDDIDARASIRCSDQAERSEQPEGDLTLADEWSEELPFWGRFFGTGTPGCWGFPEAVEPLAPIGAGDLAPEGPVVVIGTTNDPATPYEQSVDAAELIAGSVLVSYEGDIHTAYRSLSDCVDDAVTPYLIDLIAPADGLTC